MSTRGRYGVRLMTALALRYGGGVVLLRDVARQEAISQKYLGQIVIPLRTAGLIVSQRGARGGYALARPPQSITAREVLEAIEGPLAVVPEAERSTACGAGDRLRHLGALEEAFGGRRARPRLPLPGRPGAAGAGGERAGRGLRDMTGR